MYGREESYKRIQSTELIFASDVATIMIDATDASSAVMTQQSTTGNVKPDSIKVLIENFFGLYLRTKMYVKSEKAVKRVTDLFTKTDLRLNKNFTSKTVTEILEAFEAYLDAIHASSLMQLIETATKVVDR